MRLFSGFSVLLFLVVGSSRIWADGVRYQQNVVWNTPSESVAGSMPFGGGDIGCNVWVEKGDVLFYVQRSGSFSGNGEYLKLGRFRMSLLPDPFAEGRTFRQEQCLEDGTVVILSSGRGGDCQIRLWTDIFTHSVQVEVESEQERTLEVAYESWRTKDRLLSDKGRERFGCFGLEGYPGEVVKRKDEVGYDGKTVVFYHCNGERNQSPDVMIEQQGLGAYRDRIPDHNRFRTSGGVLSGEGLRVAGQDSGVYCATPFHSWKLKSGTPSRRHRWMVATHVGQAEVLADWRAELDRNREEAARSKGNRVRNREWWREFWQRSWIVTDPLRCDADTLLWKMGQNYQRMRYQLGCNFYGEWPTKFNGGSFTVDPVTVNGNKFDPDWRQWGGDLFTAQNQRLVYWPMLKAGDAGAMKAQFGLYERALPGATLRVKEFFGHAGAMFCEYANAPGLDMSSGWGWDESAAQRRRGVEVPFGDPSVTAARTYGDSVERGVMANGSIAYHWESQIEHAYMILEYHHFTGENIDRYLPFIKGALIFFDEHYQARERMRTGKPLDANGKLNIYPSTSCESYRGAKNPVDVVSGLDACLEALLKLKTKDLTAEERVYFDGFRQRLPGIFYGEVKGDRVVLPAESYVRYQNVECPQFYPLFPFNRFGPESGEMKAFRNTWKHGTFPKNMVISWHQDGIFFARMGMKKEALEYNKRKLADAPRRFPTFWGPGHDWVPDHNWGGSGMIGLQEMVMQTLGDRIYVLPAWPEGKDVMFRLHAPGRTVVEVEYVGGKLRKLEVTPEERMKDVVVGVAL